MTTLAHMRARLIEEERPLRFLTGRILWRTGLCRWLTFPVPGGYRMRFHPSAISAALWENRAFRQDDVDVCRTVLRRGDNYVDVGANVGQLAIVAAMRVEASGSVVAIEPHPRTCSFLRDNIALNGLDWIDVRNAAVGDVEGTVSFTDLPCDDQNFVAPSGPSGASVDVAMTTLDRLLPTSTVRLLKIDVEGFEVRTLQGAAKLLEGCECLYVEESARNLSRYGSDPSQLRELLRAHHFRLFSITPKGLEEDPPYVAETSSQNILAIRLDCVDSLRADFALKNRGRVANC